MQLNYPAELRAESEGRAPDVVSEEGLRERRVGHVVVDAVVDVVALARRALQREDPSLKSRRPTAAT